MASIVASALTDPIMVQTTLAGLSWYYQGLGYSFEVWGDYIMVTSSRSDHNVELTAFCAGLDYAWNHPLDDNICRRINYV